MLDIPEPIILYLLNLIIEQRSPAYLLVDQSGYILEYGGKLTAYGVEEIKPGDKVEQQIFFLEGMLPLDGSPIFIPHIKTEHGICADIHLFPSKDGDWILLLDSTVEEIQLSLIQQRLNEFVLNKEQLYKIFNQ